LACTLLMAIIGCNIRVFGCNEIFSPFFFIRLVRWMRSICAYIYVKLPRKVHERNLIVSVIMFLLFSYLSTEVLFGLLDP
jgi:hypothetical protein